MAFGFPRTQKPKAPLPPDAAGQQADPTPPATEGTPYGDDTQSYENPPGYVPPVYDGPVGTVPEFGGEVVSAPGMSYPEGYQPPTGGTGFPLDPYTATPMPMPDPYMVSDPRWAMQDGRGIPLPYPGANVPALEAFRQQGTRQPVFRPQRRGAVRPIGNDPRMARQALLRMLGGL